MDILTYLKKFVINEKNQLIIQDGNKQQIIFKKLSKRNKLQNNM